MALIGAKRLGTLGLSPAGGQGLRCVRNGGQRILHSGCGELARFYEGPNVRSKNAD